MQTVFKIQLPKDADNRDGKPFAPRRAHKKSRGACLSCKRRRIKCDEIKPRCSKCAKTNGECVYPAGSSPKTLWLDERDVASSVATPRADVYAIPLFAEAWMTEGADGVGRYTMSVDILETDLDELLGLSIGTKDEQVCSVRMLQHFQAFTSLTIGSTMCKNVMHSFVAKEAWMHPHLMHMVLAVSAAHLKRLHLEASQLDLYRQYVLAEAGHWEQGLQNHRQALTKLKPDFDATLATTFLSIVFAFSLDDEVSDDAYTTDDQTVFQEAVNPLMSTSGFRALRQFFGEFMNDSVWKQVLLGSDDDRGTFSDGTQPGIKGLPPALCDLCGLNETSNNDNNPYHLVLRLLTPLLRLEPDPENFTAVMAFCGRTWPILQPLVMRKDPVALLLLSYWFAIATQIDQWWMQQRARSECIALVRYLSELQDPTITALLPFPASLGQADLSYIWEPLSSAETTPDASAMFARYFDKGIKQLHSPPETTLTLALLRS